MKTDLFISYLNATFCQCFVQTYFVLPLGLSCDKKYTVFEIF